MNLRYTLIYVISVLTRFFPFPAKTGIYRIGNPTPDSPVLISGNYILSVELLKKELKGLNLYLLVANSRGINVWCAATGGHFSNHDVISVLKTSGIEDLVNHRRYILPQLSATGIERKVIRKKTEWWGEWGPVRASDIPYFLENSGKISRDMRTVEFPAKDRIDMAIAWATIMSVVVTLFTVGFSLNAAVISVLLCWYVSSLIFLSFPLFQSWFQSHQSNEVWKTKILHPSVIALLTVPIYYWLLSVFQLDSIFRIIEPIIGVVIIYAVEIDLKGSTPIFKSDMNDERIFDIKLDYDKCRGAGDCVTVCPKDCFVYLDEKKKVSIPRPESCVQCGACVVQCPFDALYLENLNGDRMEPDTLREFKLNLMGKRAVKIKEIV